MREEFKRNLHKIFFVHQHGCRFIVLYTNIAAVMSSENDLILTIFTLTMTHLVYPLNFAESLFSVSPGYYSCPMRNRRRWLCKIWGVGGGGEVGKFWGMHYGLGENGK